MSDEFQKHANYDINFTYLIWQNDVKRERVYYYIDGESVRRIMRMSDFHKLAYMKSPNLASIIQTHCNDYSFHMWNTVDNTVIYLSPNGKDGIYPDKVMDRVAKRSPHIIKDTTNNSIYDHLNKLGFTLPNDNDIKNLNVLLCNRESESYSNDGIFSRIFK